MTTVRRALIAAVLLAVVLVARPASAREPLRYVALGDSYTAGPFIPRQVQPYGCLKSDHDYPHLLAQSLGIPVVDASCSGAKTDHMFKPQGVDPDGPNPPQLDSLASDTTLVTLEIGGNDIGFSDIAKSCGSATPSGHPCQDKYVVNGVDELRRRIQVTGPKVAAVIQAVHQRAPEAKVFVLGYPAILPVSGPGCWPQMPIADADVPYLRGIQEALNGMIRAAADANDARYVDVYGPSAGKTACDLPVLRWVEPVVPVNAAAPVHPNLTGMTGMAAVLEDAIAKR